MAKFPTEVERSVTADVPLARAYAFMWDVVTSARCIPGIESCEAVGDDTYHFLYRERSTGPVSLVVRYTAEYAGNGTDEIRFRGLGRSEDNTDVEGLIRFEPDGESRTRITLRQMLAPDTPVPRLLQGLIRSFVEKEAASGVTGYLDNVKRTLEV